MKITTPLSKLPYPDPQRIEITVSRPPEGQNYRHRHHTLQKFSSRFARFFTVPPENAFKYIALRAKITVASVFAPEIRGNFLRASREKLPYPCGYPLE